MRPYLALAIVALMFSFPASADEMASCDGQNMRQSIDACRAILMKSQRPDVQFLALRNLAIRELALEDLLGARGDAERAIQLKPNDIVVRLVAANALAKMGKLDDAKRQVDEALKLDPKSAQALTTDSLVEVKIGNYDKAISAATKAIDLHPENPAAFNNRGLAYRGKGEYVKALYDFSQAIQMNPKFARLLLNRGVTYKMMGRRQAASKDLDEAMRLDPKMDEARLAHDSIQTEISRENADSAHRKAMEQMDAQTEATLFVVAMLNKTKGGDTLTADERLKIEGIKQKYPVLENEIKDIFRWQTISSKNDDDLKFSTKLQNECRQRRFTEEEIRRLGALDGSHGAASLLAHIVLQCQQGYVSALEAADLTKRQLAAAPPECQAGYGKLEAFSSSNKDEALIEASGLADAGDAEGACRIMEGVLNQAEDARSKLVACYHSIEDASDEQKRFKQATIFGAGQMHNLEVQLAPAMQKLHCE